MTFASAILGEADDLVKSLFDQLGKTLIVDERRLKAGMMVASCGTAFALRYARAAMEGGVQLGLYPREALEAVYQTMKGAVDLAASRGTHPEAEIDRVTTPGGITIRGLNAMEEAGFTAAVIAGLKV
jgi:pyrroline-5-carboxylate reductase